MRAMVVRRYGPPEALELQQSPEPRPKPGEVLIRVKAIGVNFADLLQRMGLYPKTPKPPFIPGLEVAGVVERTSETGRPAAGTPLRPGDAVAALAPRHPRRRPGIKWLDTALSSPLRSVRAPRPV